MEKSNNSTFVIFIFEILKFRNIGSYKFGWGSKSGTTKYKTADISKIRNFEY